MMIENGINASGGVSLSVSNEEMYALIHYAMLDARSRALFMNHLSLDEDLLHDEDTLIRGYQQLQEDGVMEINYDGVPQFVDINRDSPMVYWMLIAMSTILSHLESLVEIRIMFGRNINDMVLISDGKAWFSIWHSKGNMISMIGGLDKNNKPMTIWSKLSRFVNLTRKKTRNLIISFNRYDKNNDIMLGTSVYGCLPVFNENIPENALLAQQGGRRMIDGLYSYSSLDDVRDRIQRIVEVI